MKIREIEGKRINVSARTITIKDENNKTCGMVRNITTLNDVQPNKQIVFSTDLRKKGVSREIMMRYLDKIVIYESEMYFLVDDYAYGIAEKLGERLFNDLPELAKGTEVIHCARISWSERRK